MSISTHENVLFTPPLHRNWQVILKKQSNEKYISQAHYQSTHKKVYESLTTEKGLAGWWTPETIAQPETGSIARFPFGPTYYKEMEIMELNAPSNIKWKCVKGFDDWIGTTIDFELAPHDKGTVLLFHHDGWKEITNEFAGCSYDWAMFLRSLAKLCETGKGLPYPEQYN